MLQGRVRMKSEFSRGNCHAAGIDVTVGLSGTMLTPALIISSISNNSITLRLSPRHK